MAIDKKSYVILTSSQKGGVGKTIVAVNVAAALKTAGYDVLLVDTDVANPSIGPQLGMHNMGTGYAEIVKGKAKVEDVQTVYMPNGFYIIHAGGKGEQLIATQDEINEFYSKIKKMNFDFIVIDTPPGALLDGSLKNFDEALIITTPEETSVFGAQHLAQLYDKYHLIHKLVINRVREDKFELDEERIEKLYGDIAYAMLPEDRIIIESESKHLPAYTLNRTSYFSLAIDELCKAYTLKAGTPTPTQRKGFGRFFGMK